MVKSRRDHRQSTLQMLEEQSVKYFNLSVGQIVESRGHVLWALEIDSRKRKLSDMIGNIPPRAMTELSRPERFFDTDAGFKASAQTVLPLGDCLADIFLINADHIKKGERLCASLLVHELCHFIEDTNNVAAISFSADDDENANIIMSGLDEDVRRIHSLTWARLLAWAARQGHEHHGFPSIARSIELAIPSYDRPHWKPELIRQADR